MKHEVEFKDITHRYGNRQVISRFTLSFEKNHISAIIGRSGSGKSTLLQMINGMIVPAEGTVHVSGSPIDYPEIRHLRLKIGYSVQGTGLFPHMTIFENISLVARVNKMKSPDIEERVSFLLEMVNLSKKFRNKYPHELSGGEQQRVGICRAMMLNPPIFLLDEAFGALDPTTRSELHEEFTKLQNIEPRTVILVTHDLREAFKLAQKVAIIEAGELQQFDAPREIRKNPANDFVQQFIHRQLD